MRTFLAGWFCLLCSVSVFSAEIERRVVPDGLISIDIPAPESEADGSVVWEARQPLDLDFRTFETRNGKSVLIFHGEPGEEFIVVSDAIWWEARKRSKVTWVIKVQGDPEPEPEPDPQPEPNPEPNPEPEPDPDIDNPFAKAVYDRAKAIGDRQNAAKLAAIYRTVASQIGAGGIRSLDQAKNEVTRRIGALNLPVGWARFGTFMRDETNRQAQTLPSARGLFEATADGLEAYAGVISYVSPLSPNFRR